MHPPDRISVPDNPAPPRLLNQVRDVVRYRHYSLRTEQAYTHWIRQYIHWHAHRGGMRHPRELGAQEVRDFLTMLTTQRHVSVSTHNQALSALLFLYREVLGTNLPWLTDLQRPTRPRRIPSVLSQAETTALLSHLQDTEALLGRLLYGTGMRLSEGLGLRIKDLDFARQTIVVRQGKGGKDRVVMLPQSLVQDLRQQLANAGHVWESDRRDGSAAFNAR